MANSYYSLEQVCQKLGVSQSDVKSMVGDRRLTEVRDGGKTFYRTDEVDHMAGKADSSIVDLAVPEGDQIKIDETESFATALSSLADSSSDLGILEDTAEGAAPLRPEDVPEQLPSSPSVVDELSSEIGLLPVNEGKKREGAKLSSADQVPDLGLSGSSIIALEAADEDKPQKPMKPRDAKSGAGIMVFDDADLAVDTDPMEKTHIAPAVDIDAAGGGSGLLDLTQEKDDTSLGEILDVISPTDAGDDEAPVVAVAAEDDEDAFAGAAPSMAGAMPALAARRAAVGMAGATQLNVTIGLGLLSLAVLGLATAGQIQGVWPGTLLDALSKGVVSLAVFIGVALVAAAMGVWSILQDRGR